MITLEQIGRELGVSTTTVSYALGQKWQQVGISEATRERILAKARKLGYRRNPIATSLKTKITKTVGVIVPALGGDTYGQMLHGIESALGLDYTPLLGVSDYDEAKERRALESFYDRLVDGLVIVHAGYAANRSLLHKMQEFEIPVVQVDRHWPEVVSDIVEPDNDAIGFALTQRFIQRGCRNIHFLRSPHTNIGTLERAGGYERAMREAGLRAKLWPARPVTVADHVVFSEEQTRQLLRQAGRPFVVVANDLSLVFGALRVLREAGLEEGKDFLLGGVTSDQPDPMHDFLPDCITLAGWSIKELGRIAGDLLRQRMQVPDGEPGQFRTVRIPCRILEREREANQNKPTAQDAVATVER